MKWSKLAFFALLIGVYGNISAQTKKQATNYDEQKVPVFQLPDLLTCQDGTPVKTAKDWERKRRPEIMEFFQSNVYGRTPKDKIKVAYEPVAKNTKALGGLATMEQVYLHFKGQKQERKALMLVLYPNERKGKVPVFVSYNFKGNPTTLADNAILYSPLSSQMVPPTSDGGARGGSSSRWDYENIIKRGYGIVVMCYHDIFPDGAKYREQSILPLFKGYTKQLERDDEWQSIGAWAWGASRMADYVVKQKWADAEKLIVIGHSRLGKTALWAGAQDKRFKVVISNDSGCGGAALSKRAFGETVWRITKTFPHWFCPKFTQYGINEEALPMDQHGLIALIAPRHAYVASAQADAWADPRGEYLSAYYASPVWKLYGLEGITQKEMPAIHQPNQSAVGHHIRAGKHDVTDYDWKCYLDYCDKWLK